MKIYSLKAYGLILTLIIGLASCQDIVTYDDDYDDGLTSTGVPVITKVTAVDNEEAELDGSAMGEMIAIHGSNLSNVKSIVFNDVATDVKTVYAVNSKILLPVPRVIPNEVTNKIVITTELGSVSRDFAVAIPQLFVEGLYNEFATPGDTVEVVGRNFDLYQLNAESGSVFVNETEVTILKATADRLTIAIPEGTADNSTVKVVSPIEEPIVVPFRDWGLSIQNYLDGIWGDTEKYLTDGSNPGDPDPLAGIAAFSRIKGNFEAWSWNVPFGYGFNLEDADMAANPQNYVVKMEVLTKSNRALSIGNLIVGSYSWNPGAGGLAFNTYDAWRTVSFAVSDVFPDLKSGEWNNFSVVFQPSENYEADFSFSNARIVKK